MAIKVGRMLKYFLIFNIIFSFTTIVSAQENNVNPDSSTSIVLIANEDVKTYSAKPLVMSLILPGSGQYYNKSPFWKTASFIGVEIGSILAWNHYNNKADDIKNSYQNFADENWTLQNWVTNKISQPSDSDGRSWTSFSELESFSGTHDLTIIISAELANHYGISRTLSTDILDSLHELGLRDDVSLVRDRHFYENIGKYDQFVGGWSDAENDWYWEEKDVGDEVEEVIKTPKKAQYINQRYDSNRFLNAAKYSITVLMFNHVISGIEAVWSARKNASNNKESQTILDPKLDLVYNPSNPLGIGGLRLTFHF